MGYSQETPNYHLPQYLADDRPSYLGDWNEAMGVIDGGMQENKTGLIEANVSITNMKTYVDNSVEDLTTSVDEKVQTMDARITDNTGGITSAVDTISKTVKEMSWNCCFRQIVGSNEELGNYKSAQGFTIINDWGSKYLAQITIDNTTSTIILYDFINNIELTRITGDYGHLNDLTYFNGKLYALNDVTQKIYVFNVTSNLITYNSVINTPTKFNGFSYYNGAFWCVVTQGAYNDVVVYKYNEPLNALIETFTIPYEGSAIIQGLSVNDDFIMIATTAPNEIIMYRFNDNSHYLIPIPEFIGHCFTDEVEGVYIDELYNVYINTNSTVDYLLMCSIFKTNLITNVEKEISSSVSQGRTGGIVAVVDNQLGSLVSPAQEGNKFKLAGDALNYAKFLDFEVTLSFEKDYPYTIVINNMSVNLAITGGADTINLNGLICRFSKINVINPSKFILNPKEIDSLLSDGVYYGSYFAQCDVYISVGTWGTPQTPYDATHKRSYYYNSLVLIQELSYTRFFNCLVKTTSTTLPATSICERTGIVPHIS